ncbi:MAG: thiamine pyrophosphate-dependent enzyme, partial [Desulfobacteria bacterium]
HTTHGRALGFATGIKMAKPDKHVIVVSGDGDATAIGGNHFIHACRRNIDITLLVFNNYIYGMTGGQYSPTTPSGHLATTMPYGNIDPSFNIPELAKGAGASFVARGTAYHAAGLDRLIIEAMQHKGLSVVEIMNACPTTHGRRNKFKSPTDMLLWMKDTFIPAVAFDKLPPEKTAGKLPMGVLYKKEGLPEYCETYYGMVARLKKQKEGRA